MASIRDPNSSFLLYRIFLYCFLCMMFERFHMICWIGLKVNFIHRYRKIEMSRIRKKLNHAMDLSVLSTKIHSGVVESKAKNPQTFEKNDCRAFTHIIFSIELEGSHIFWRVSRSDILVFCGSFENFSRELDIVDRSLVIFLYSSRVC